MNNPFENPPKPTDIRAAAILQDFAAVHPYLYQEIVRILERSSLSEAEQNLAIIGGLEAFVENGVAGALRIKILPSHIERMHQLFNPEQNLHELEKQLTLRMGFRFKRNPIPRQNEHQYKRAAVLGNHTSTEAWRLAYVLSLYVTEVEAIAKENN